jgi:hypothetical protein
MVLYFIMVVVEQQLVVLASTQLLSNVLQLVLVLLSVVVKV